MFDGSPTVSGFISAISNVVGFAVLYGVFRILGDTIATGMGELERTILSAGGSYVFVTAFAERFRNTVSEG